MSKGVIVQFNEDSACIMKNDGAFISCTRDKDWQIGDVVTISRHRWFSKKIVLASCIAILIVMISFGYYIISKPSSVQFNNYQQTTMPSTETFNNKHRWRHMENCK